MQPKQAIVGQKVDVPTIVLQTLRPGTRQEVCVQWYGKASSGDVNRWQFFFPIPIPENDQIWMSHPEKFGVVFMGPIHQWPNPELIEEVAQKLAGGDRDAIVIYLASRHYQVRHSDGVGPATLAVKITVMLADSVYGIITPRLYRNPNLVESSDLAKKPLRKK